MADLPTAPPATLVIFGSAFRSHVAVGDLQIIGIGSRDGDDEMLRAGLDEFTPKDDCWQKLRGRITYLSGDFTQDDLYNALKDKLPDGNAAFYLAVAPQFFGTIVD